MSARPTPLFLLLGLAVAASAEEGGAATGHGELPTITVTATRTGVVEVDEAAAVSVIEAERIQRTPALNTLDLLRGEPGVDVKRLLGPATAIPNFLALRGVPGPNRALYLIDGIPTNGAGTGFIEFNEVPLIGLRRTEVVRGPFSALYGANAFGGVINVLTEDGLGGDRVEVRGGGGADGFGQGAALVAGRRGPVAIAASASVSTMDNYWFRDDQFERSRTGGAWVETPVSSENHDYRDARALIKTTIDLESAGLLVVQGRYFERSTGLGLSDALPQPRDKESDDQRWALGASWQGEFGPTELRLAGYYRHGEDALRTQTQYTVPAFGPPFFRSKAYALTDAETTAEEWLGQAQINWKQQDVQTLTVGVDWTVNSSDYGHTLAVDTGLPVPGSVEHSADLRNIGIYAQDQIALGDDGTLTPGLRYDEQSQVGGFWSPRLAGLWRFDEAWRVRGSAGRAFRAPALSETDKPEWSQTSNVRLRPNPDLAHETINAYDAGLRWSRDATTTADLDLFLNDMRDLIGTSIDQVVLTNPVGSAPILVNSYRNISRARSYGATGALHAEPITNLSLDLNATWQRAYDRDTDLPLEYLPRLKANLSVGWRQPLGACSFDAQAVTAWVGTREYQPYGPPGTPRFELPSYVRQDVQARFGWHERTWVGVSVQNLFDRDYEESGGSLAPGRMLLVEAGAQF